ncbi:MAG: 3-deoxy-manno-octulosonate cytidylyltransferase [Fimbriimonadaceae bacterium]|nr:3-deoxy-manno-octulosonate cytidylyltransferase [Fimbriimonadaceae bacterium]
MTCLIVIPARMGSTRFPGKPLCDLLGKPMVQWVYEAAEAANIAEEVVVATPDQEIVDACSAFGARGILTDIAHPTGTDRIAEVARRVPADVYVNVQGDEPLIRAESIAACAKPMLTDSAIQMASVYCPADPQDEDNPNVVKVVLDANEYAMYFSRWAIPFPRNPRVEPLLKHIGLYAYTGDALRRFSELPPSPLETAESLEQLRFMQAGIRIKMSPAPGTELAVDTPEQAEMVRQLLSSRN